MLKGFYSLKSNLIPQVTLVENQTCYGKLICTQTIKTTETIKTVTSSAY